VRIDFLRRAIEIASSLDAQVVSLWSGVLGEPLAEESAMERLRQDLLEVLAHAEKSRVVLAFEPEPGMFIDTFARFRALDDRIEHPLFQLTVDVGHVHCIEAGAVADHLRAWAPRIRNVHIEDMVRGVHDHLMFGEGTVDFAGAVDALAASGYSGGLHVELSRHSHMGVEAVRRSRDFLVPLINSASSCRVKV
jgi:sugar phosphate isomerase/epimerase